MPASTTRAPARQLRVTITDRIDAVEAADWDALAAAARGRRTPQPFVSHAFLHALEVSGCVGPGTGWQPCHLLLVDASGSLRGAVPQYLKSHSYGEYVFDWAWADAYRRHGRAYYPKLLCAVPFTPVAGARLLAADEQARAALAGALVEHARAGASPPQPGASALRPAGTRARPVSSLHVLFPDPAEAQLLGAAGMMLRRGVQFHWNNRDYADFDAFLADLAQPKRKKIRAERRKVAQAGVTLERRTGSAIDDEHWRFFARCYDNTYAEHHSTPYLNLEFFRRIGARMPECTTLVLAWRDGRRIAASLLIGDEDRLYGRYWGALEHVPCLHFEVCYYQAIEEAIARRLAIVEGGAQGEHKMARGFEPVPTVSMHWLAEPAFASAVDDFLAREGAMVVGYLDELRERSPFKADTDGCSDQPPPSER